MAPPPFFEANETKRPEKIFLSLRVFWARQHRRRLVARTVPSGCGKISARLLGRVALLFASLLLCFGRFVSLFFVAVAFGFALALLFDCFALGLLLGA
jgi:ABC-type nitrate/sulfonate/bicarbonate transport system permease component